MALGRALAKTAKKLTGLFIDDRYFAAAVAIWIALLAVSQHLAHVASGTLGIGFFFGLAIILVVSVARAARSTRQ